MTAPSTIVTFADADGDEFPVRVWALGPPTAEIDRRAEAALAEMEAEGDLSPRRPVTIVSREEA